MSMSELIELAIDDKIKDIQTGMIGKIESFDSDTFRADVKPLLKIKNNQDEEEELPILADLPVMFYKGGDFFIKPQYENGDLVWIGFSTYDYENALREYIRLRSDKKFEIHNAIVLGGIVKDNFSGNGNITESGLVIGDSNYFINFDGSKLILSDGNLKIQFDGSAIIIGNTTGIHLKIDSSGIFAITSPGVQFNILTHTHPTAATGPPSPPTPGT